MKEIFFSLTLASLFFFCSPVQAVDQNENITPMLSILLSNGVEMPRGSCASQGLPGPETIMWKTREWQRCPGGFGYSWEEAKSFCQGLVLDDHSDWHLPHIDELKSLVVCTNGVITPLLFFPNIPYSCRETPIAPINYDQPTFDPSFAPAHPYSNGGNYWTSSIYPYDPDHAWFVAFDDGHALGELTDYKWYVRCVR